MSKFQVQASSSFVMICSTSDGCEVKRLIIFSHKHRSILKIKDDP